jgi:AraC-like DNA-binding protein/mannose-6-phosphate isomerase-like protein (cupin superfamily)
MKEHLKSTAFTMPKIRNLQNDIDALMDEVLRADRPAVTVGVETETTGWDLGFHAHDKAQVMLSVRGIGLCEAESGVWLVPPDSALFLPVGTEHRVTTAGKIEGYAVFLEPDRRYVLPSKTTTIAVNALLRELIIRSSHFPADYERGGIEDRVMALLLDEIAAASTGGLHLPMPTDRRLRAIFHGMMQNPSDRGTIKVWAKRASMSERTLARTIAAETGMSFGRWRHRLNLILALQWMATGASVEETAIDLGYENVGSFITMFRKALGSTPARYMAERAASR